MAIAVLSGLPSEDLVAAIMEEDAARLTRIKGVGKKTAEQILLDLRDRAAQLAGGAGGTTREGVLTPKSAPSPADSNVADAVSALVSIGYSEKEARKQVERAAQRVDPGDLERLVRSALAG